MKIPFFFLMLMGLVAVGCGDEGIEYVLNDLTAPAAPASPVLTEVPAEIQKMLWGDRDAFLKDLLDVLEDGVYETKDGPILDTAGNLQRNFIDQICLLETQQEHYTKYIDAGGIAIMGDRHVNDRHLYATQEAVLAMTSKRPELREALSPIHGFRLILINANLWGPASIPEVETHTRSTWTGLGWCSRDSNLGYNDNYFCVSMVWMDEQKDEIQAMGVFVHEFGHAIHNAINRLDTTFQDRLEAAYTNALETGGVWGKDNYAMVDVREYWAVGVHDWFYDVAQADIPQWRTIFIEKDPLLYALLEEWLPLIYLAPIQYKW